MPKPHTPSVAARWEIAVASLVLIAMVVMYVRFQQVEQPAVPQPKPALTQDATSPSSPPADLE